MFVPSVAAFLLRYGRAMWKKKQAPTSAGNPGARSSKPTGDQSLNASGASAGQQTVVSFECQEALVTDDADQWKRYRDCRLRSFEYGR
jgi:hypothetical protein